MKSIIENLVNVNINSIDKNLKDCGKVYLIVLEKYKHKQLELNKKEIEYSNLYAERYSYYKCDYDFQLTNQEIKNFIEHDIETAKIRLEIKNLKTEIEILEKHLQNISALRWDIKTLVDYMKLDKII